MTTSTSAPTSQQPEAAKPSKPSNAMLALWIAIAVAAVSILGIALLAGVLVFSGSGTDVTSTGGEVGTEELLDAPAQDPPTVSNDGAEELLLAFAETWRTADWTKMATLASADVVTVAQDWYSEGGYPNITESNMEFVIDTCHATASGGTDCFFTYAPPDGFGLIFNITFADNGTGLSVTQLTFGGDAG